MSNKNFKNQNRRNYNQYANKPEPEQVKEETVEEVIEPVEETVEEVIEPFLLQEGFVKRSQRGRIATEKAYKHLHIPIRNK